MIRRVGGNPRLPYMEERCRKIIKLNSLGRNGDWGGTHLEVYGKRKI